MGLSRAVCVHLSDRPEVRQVKSPTDHNADPVAVFHASNARHASSDAIGYFGLAVGYRRGVDVYTGKRCL